MSAALAYPQAQPVGRPATPRARHLVAVPDALPAARSGGGLRMTRRGRAALTGLVTALALSVGGVAMATTGADPQPVTVTVEQGQTLSEVAAAELPDLPVAEGVARLQLSNGLASSQVHAGQRLVVPAP